MLDPQTPLLSPKVNPAKATLSVLSVAALSCLLTSCAQSKAAQCKQLVNIASVANETAREAATGKPDAMRRAAESFDRAANDLNKLALADSDLKQHGSRLADIYADTSHSTRDFLNAIQQKDRNLAEIAVQSLEQSANSERSLIQDINRTCQVSESAASKP
ncbi:MAG: hypothetical protein EA001_14215 [Oscillatoriales cyanobacterium]|nr:MAG: hypothetical protein EA001_14215 [Oscillatoriales cyanobacterium]